MQMKPAPLHPITIAVVSATVFGASVLIGRTVLAQTDTTAPVGTIDITNVILTRRSADCADYAATATSRVMDVQEQKTFVGAVEIAVADETCVLSSNNIPTMTLTMRRRSLRDRFKRWRT
jgi:hypothetical protein